MSGLWRFGRVVVAVALVACMVSGLKGTSVSAQEGNARVVVDFASATKSGEVSTCGHWAQHCGYWSGSGATVNGLEQWSLDLALTSSSLYYLDGSFRLASTTHPGDYIAGFLSVSPFSDLLSTSVTMRVREGGGAYAGYVSAPGPGPYPGAQPLFKPLRHTLDLLVTSVPVDLELYAGSLAWDLMPA